MTLSQIEAVAPAARSNPGETLRLAREAKGWQLAEVAAQLNLTAHSLNQLEAGAFERLPGHTFARGYVRSYAKLLGLDQAELVEAFDAFTGTDAQGSCVHSLGHVPEPMRLSRTVVLRLVSGVLLLLLLLLCYFWWQERPERLANLGVFGLKHIEVESADGTTELHPLEEPEDQAVAESRQDRGITPLDLPQDDVAQAPPAAAPVEAASSSSAAAVSALPVAAAPAVPAAAPAVEQEPAAPASSAEPAPGANEPLPAVRAGEGLVQASFDADCWVQVSDGNGRVLLSSVKRAGESLQVAGRMPLELRLGNARAARDVRFNGDAVEHLKNMSASGTARLHLGP